MSRYLLAGLLFLTGCIPTTEMIQDGHYSIQLTQSHNVWGQNVVHITRCLNTDKKDGFCTPQDSRQYEYSETVAGPGPQLVSAAFLGASIVGGAALMMHGLQTQRVAGGLNVNETFSTKYIGK